MCGPALDRKANNPAAEAERPKERRYRLRRQAAKVLRNHRTCTCGWRLAEVVTIVKNKHGTCDFVGLQSCGSVWACPVCSSKIGAHRSEEVRELVRAHAEAGGTAYMLTLTIRHNVRDHCVHLRHGISRTWQRFAYSRAWREIKKTYGVAGYVRALEITHGANGWHPHYHVLVFLDRDPGEGAEGELRTALFDQWQTAAAGIGFAVNPDALDLTRCSSPDAAADYVAKWGTAAEVSAGQDKRGRQGSRSPWQLLAASKSDRRARALYREYVRAMHGARHLTWSRGIRERYDLRAAAEDAAIAEQPELGLDADVTEIARVDKGTWQRLSKAGLQGRLLIAAETGGAEAVQELLSGTVGPSYLKRGDRRWFKPPRPALTSTPGELQPIAEEIERWTTKVKAEMFRHRRRQEAWDLTVNP